MTTEATELVERAGRLATALEENWGEDFVEELAEDEAAASGRPTPWDV